MSNDRSSGFGGGFISFKSGESRVTSIPDKKRSKNENQNQNQKDNEENKEELQESEFVDNSAQLRATLNSLAIMNAASVIKKGYNGINISKNSNQTNPINKD